MKHENQAQNRASSQDNNKKLDDICERLDLLEAISELFYIWKKVDMCNSDELLTAKAMGVLGEFFCTELAEMNRIIACEVMDRPSVLEDRGEVSQ